MDDKCPSCGKDLDGYTREYRVKHIYRCMRCRPKYVYTGRPVGRPPRRRPIKTPKDKE